MTSMSIPALIEQLARLVSESAELQARIAAGRDRLAACLGHAKGKGKGEGKGEGEATPVAMAHGITERHGTEQMVLGDDPVPPGAAAVVGTALAPYAIGALAPVFNFEHPDHGTAGPGPALPTPSQPLAGFPTWGVQPDTAMSGTRDGAPPQDGPMTAFIPGIDLAKSAFKVKRHSIPNMACAAACAFHITQLVRLHLCPGHDNSESATQPLST